MSRRSGSANSPTHISESSAAQQTQQATEPDAVNTISAETVSDTASAQETENYSLNNTKIGKIIHLTDDIKQLLIIGIAVLGSIFIILEMCYQKGFNSVYGISESWISSDYVPLLTKLIIPLMFGIAGTAIMFLEFFFSESIYCSLKYLKNAKFKSDYKYCLSVVLCFTYSVTDITALLRITEHSKYSIVYWILIILSTLIKIFYTFAYQSEKEINEKRAKIAAVVLLIISIFFIIINIYILISLCLSQLTKEALLIIMMAIFTALPTNYCNSSELSKNKLSVKDKKIIAALIILLAAIISIIIFFIGITNARSKNSFESIHTSDNESCTFDIKTNEINKIPDMTDLTDEMLSDLLNDGLSYDKSTDINEILTYTEQLNISNPKFHFELFYSTDGEKIEMVTPKILKLNRSDKRSIENSKYLVLKLFANSKIKLAETEDSYYTVFAYDFLTQTDDGTEVRNIILYPHLKSIVSKGDVEFIESIEYNNCPMAR